MIVQLCILKKAKPQQSPTLILAKRTARQAEPYTTAEVKDTESPVLKGSVDSLKSSPLKICHFKKRKESEMARQSPQDRNQGQEEDNGAHQSPQNSPSEADTGYVQL